MDCERQSTELTRECVACLLSLTPDCKCGMNPPPPMQLIWLDPVIRLSYMYVTLLVMGSASQMHQTWHRAQRARAAQ